MLKSPLLFAISVLVTLLSWTGIAKAEDLAMGLNFDLPAAPQQQVTQQQVNTPPLELEVEPAIAPTAPSTTGRIEIASTLPLSRQYQQEALPPITQEIAATEIDKETLIAPSEEAGTDIALSFAANSVSMPLASDSADAVPDATSVEANSSDLSISQASEHSGLEHSALEHSDPEQSGLKQNGASTDLSALNFGLPVISDTETDIAINPLVEHPELIFSASSLGNGFADGEADSRLGLDDWIFEQGTDSLVARTVGSAEGTRHWNGERTRAYYGHVDPGNGVWNLGTFSYQHGARNPEEADQKQLNRLQRQGDEIVAQAAAQGLELSLEEKLNALDLANQAPLAALDRGGYIDRLAQARRLNMAGTEAILWARTHSYIDPDTRRWNAPGLGNNVNSISRDQERRMVAISKALRAFNPENIDSRRLASLNSFELESTPLNLPQEASAIAETQASAPSDSGISFGLPPVDESILINAGTIASALMPTDAPSEPPATEENTTVLTTAARAETDLAETDSAETDLAQSEVTQNEAAQDIEADNDEGSTAEMEQLNEVASVDEADLFTINAPAQSNAEVNEADKPLAAAIETSAADPEPNPEPNAASEPDDVSDPTAAEPAELEESVQAEPQNSTDIEASPSRLEQLLAGIQLSSTDTSASEDAEAASSEPSRSFWRTEDKIVPAK
ncbi:MAG: hypothetical protein AAFY33_19110 [Cyanobacteria bacterium J06643_4]